LRFVLEIAHAGVGGGDAAEVDGGAQAVVCGSHLVGFVSQQADVDHGPAVYPTAVAAGSADWGASSLANSSRIRRAAPARPPPMCTASSSANSAALWKRWFGSTASARSRIWGAGSGSRRMRAKSSRS